MVRGGSRFTLASHITLGFCVISLCLLTATSARAAEDDDVLSERKLQKNSFAIRPKIGANWLIQGEWEKTYGEFIQGELGLKGTLGHFGLEVGLGGMGNDATVTVTGAGAGKREHDLRMLSLKLTGTYEFNPLAGVRGHEGEGNLYLGGGFGFYPVTEEVEFTPANPLALSTKDEIDGFGYGFHLVIGGEYFFARNFGLFAELQYGYTDFDREARSNTNINGFSTLAGIAVKF